MSKGLKYLLVSLPTSISPSNDHDEALTALRSAVTTDYGSVFPFQIPEFKIGTLDALVQQADDLSKLGQGCEAVVGKVGDSLKNILEGDEEKISQQKTVNDSKRTHYSSPASTTAVDRDSEPAEQYLKSFHWNKVKYRADKPLGEIVITLQKVATSILSKKTGSSVAESAYRRSLASTTMSRTSTINTIRSRHF